MIRNPSRELGIAVKAVLVLIILLNGVPQQTIAQSVMPWGECVSLVVKGPTAAQVNGAKFIHGSRAVANVQCAPLSDELVRAISR